MFFCYYNKVVLGLFSKAGFFSKLFNLPAVTKQQFFVIFLVAVAKFVVFFATIAKLFFGFYSKAVFFYLFFGYCSKHFIFGYCS